MIAAHFAEQLRSKGNRVALYLPERTWSYGELLQQAQQVEPCLAPLVGQSIGIVGHDLPTRIVGLLAADLSGVTPCLFPAGMNTASINDWTARLGLTGHFNAECVFSESSLLRVSQPPSTASEARPLSLWVFTSGTTGPPQPVQHTWAGLTAAVHASARYQGRRWLLAYDPASFAGLQVMLQALLTGGTLSDVAQATPVEVARRIVAEQVEFASGTPTFWRMLLGSVDPMTWRAAKLEQITLGGEAISQGTLSALQTAFPNARLSHIYATSELGVCFSVSDGLAGFPAGFLRNPPARCQLRISSEDELEVLSTHDTGTLNEANGQLSADDAAPAWRGTGDLVELRDDRVYFIGRRSSTIHVGGGKVMPEEVEMAIRGVPGVAEVRVSGQASSVLGALVRADVIPLPGTDIVGLRAAILAHCHSQLPRHKVPAMIEFHTELPCTPSGKLVRRAGMEE